MMTKFRCSECDWYGVDENLLRAPNPFAEADDETITGCPECREVNTMRLACDEPGCWEESTCGVQTPDGYRRVCSRHYSALSKSGVV